MATSKKKAEENGGGTVEVLEEVLSAEALKGRKARRILTGLVKLFSEETMPKTIEDLKEVENVEIVEDKEARRIILPHGMGKRDAAKELNTQADAEEKVINVDASFEGWNWQDVLVAVKRVSERTFGWMNGQNIYTWMGVIRPTEVDVITDVKNGKAITEKCFHGRFASAAWNDAQITVDINKTSEVQISTNCQKKFSEQVSQYYNMIREHLSRESIYRAKTVAITADSRGQWDFEIIENKGNPNIILNDEEESVLDKFILPALSDKGKRCYLFTGDYGTGKTETALRVGREAVERGLTFFYCKHANVFDKFLNLSKRYQPAVVFLEDVDEIAGGEDRDSDINAILNTIDGVQTKGNTLTVLFSTNDADKINPALRRPGRIDIILKFEYPQLGTKKKIYEHLLAGVAGADKIDYDEAAMETPDVQAAVLAEICVRCKKLADRQGSIDTTDLKASISSMKFQIDFMKAGVKKQDKGKMAMKWALRQIAKEVYTYNERAQGGDIDGGDDNE